ncbi:hypothetical protein [Crocinitomix catalasitica]|uniref:hypothetical protein n=1 Tax=Crocinitomix catalasitica TaxID=184607 RepID=UPI000483E97F|nr:hypothetical protein [Crocinitomix catalasitica]
MKNKLFLILPFALILIVAACNKDQKAVKTLDGSWELVKVDGEAIEAEDEVTYTFDNCKLRKEEYCNVTMTDAESTITEEYKIEDDGETLVIKTDFEGASFELSSKILDLTDTDLKLEINLFGSPTISEFKKI